MTAHRRSRFDLLYEALRESEERSEERLRAKSEEWERRFELILRENAALKTQVAFLWGERARTPDAWREGDTDEGRRSA